MPVLSISVGEAQASTEQRAWRGLQQKLAARTRGDPCALPGQGRTLLGAHAISRCSFRAAATWGAEGLTGSPTVFTEPLLPVVLADARAAAIFALALLAAVLALFDHALDLPWLLPDVRQLRRLGRHQHAHPGNGLHNLVLRQRLLLRQRRRLHQRLPADHARQARQAAHRARLALLWCALRAAPQLRFERAGGGWHARTGPGPAVSGRRGPGAAAGRQACAADPVRPRLLATPENKRRAGALPAGEEDPVKTILDMEGGLT